MAAYDVNSAGNSPMPRKPAIPLPKNWPRFAKSSLLHATSLVRLALLEVRSGFENSPDPRARQAAEIDRLRELLALRDEELRIKDARTEAIEPRRRPHYPAAERLAILLLRARAGWTAAETARRYLVTEATIASWMRRLDEQGQDALVRTPEPINRFPDPVALLVQKTYAAARGAGKRRIADVLGRAGLHLAASTVARLKRRRVSTTPTPAPGSDPEPAGDPATAAVKPPAHEAPAEPASGCSGDARSSGGDEAIGFVPAHAAPRVVTARYPHHVHHVDITLVPTLGLWVPWLAFALPQCWPFAWHVVVVLDHCSRAVMSRGVFPNAPTAAEVCGVLDDAIAQAGRAPRYIVSDSGTQFREEYRAWCRKHGVRPRFGAIGKHGSIAVIERFFGSMKREFFRRMLVPLAKTQMERALDSYVRWYNTVRPHRALGGTTPVEKLQKKTASSAGLLLEPRARFPLARGDPSAPEPRRVSERLELVVSYVDGHKELPVIELRDAA